MSIGKMNAELTQLGGNTNLVIAKATGFNLGYPNTIIRIEGAFSDSIAKGVLRMLKEDQCPECGKFNGLHGDIYHVTSNGDGSGEVRGYYEGCPLGPDKGKRR